ncbi:MAG: 23S rRNA (adenine(2503)-C(2))-methyltransferase RlmN [Acidobacteriota bacterium]
MGRTDSRPNLVGMTRQELEALVEGWGEARFRGRQLYHHLYRRKNFDLEAMTDLSRDFRRRLADACRIELPSVLREDVAADGTTKYLLGLEDGRKIETVYIPEEGRDTLCISSQVGCAVGCTFCMTARMGFQRNLTPGEIVGQVLQVMRQGKLPQRGFNIVFMGMGEPLYNYKNVMKAFRLLIDPEGMDLSYRKITVSTSGVVPVLERLAGEDPVPNLAISLNAVADEVRDRIMPINRKWSMETLLDTLRRFPLEPRRRITIEYVLLAGENDRPADARRLVQLLRGLRVKVNLIPYNENPGLGHCSPGEESVLRFQEILRESGVAAFIRRRRGADIGAACGQLAVREALKLKAGSRHG